jgi:erythronate-4-phosphate dehydrogenase
MKIVIDRNIPFAREAFDHLGKVLLVGTGEVSPRVVADADALIVRSETRVDSALLGGSAVRFVGTATIGTDHVDRGYLEGRGIQFASAPGSNANSVAEYVMAALCTLAGEREKPLRGMTLGVVGVGNVGSKVARKAGALGMTVLLNDPPLERVTGDRHLLPLEDLMGADVISLHVPLIDAGSDMTLKLFGGERLRRMKPGATLINTSRGAVVDGQELAAAVDRGHLLPSVFDVWEHEPGIDVDLLARLAIVTPHIAGYSMDGKLNAVMMMHHALCHSVAADPRSWPSPSLPSPEISRVHLRMDGRGEEGALRELISRCYDIRRDDRRLRSITLVPPEERGRFFRNLRKEYPVRREFAATTILLPQAHAALADTLRALGFTVLPEEVRHHGK